VLVRTFFVLMFFLLLISAMFLLYFIIINIASDYHKRINSAIGSLFVLQPFNCYNLIDDM